MLCVLLIRLVAGKKKEYPLSLSLSRLHSRLESRHRYLPSGVRSVSLSLSLPCRDTHSSQLPSLHTHHTTHTRFFLSLSLCRGQRFLIRDDNHRETRYTVYVPSVTPLDEKEKKSRDSTVADDTPPCLCRTTRIILRIMYTEKQGERAVQGNTRQQDTTNNRSSTTYRIELIARAVTVRLAGTGWPRRYLETSRANTKTHEDARSGHEAVSRSRTMSYDGFSAVTMAIGTDSPSRAF